MRYDVMNEHYTEIRLFENLHYLTICVWIRIPFRKDYIYMKSDMMMKRGNQFRLQKAF